MPSAPADQGRQPARPTQITAVARVFRQRLRPKAVQDRELIQAALRQMEADLTHPSLRVRPIAGQPGTWEARASRALRISFEFEGADQIRLLVNCSHDQVYG